MTNLSNLRNALQHFDTKSNLTPYAVGFDTLVIDYGIMHHIKQNLWDIHFTTFKEQMITSMKSKWHLLVSIRKTLKSNLKMNV